MSVCIIGDGLAGLACAAKLKLANPSVEILLIGNGRAGNTMVAGQRFRPRIENKKGIREGKELVGLFEEHNLDETLSPINLFTMVASNELRFWAFVHCMYPDIISEPLPWSQQDSWFGPQWGKANRSGAGRGRSVIRWFRNICLKLGVLFLDGTVVRLQRNRGSIEYIVLQDAVQNVRVRSCCYVLAGGSIGGRMFSSTNVPILNSPQELAFEAGCELSGATTHMFHILGNVKSTGESKTGCYETDLLSSKQIFLYSAANSKYNIYDAATTALLSQHKAHNHFHEICERFLEHGGTVEIRDQESGRRYARVSHHYSHLGVRTDDGVTVSGLNNLYAIGDACSTGYWTEYQSRKPGLALTNCLVTACLVSAKLANMNNRDSIYQEVSGKSDVSIDGSDQVQISFEKSLRSINTECLLDIHFSSEIGIAGKARLWRERLRELSPVPGCSAVLYDISLATAASYITEDYLNNRPIFISRREANNDF